MAIAAATSRADVNLVAYQRVVSVFNCGTSDFGKNQVTTKTSVADCFGPSDVRRPTAPTNCASSDLTAVSRSVARGAKMASGSASGETSAVAIYQPEEETAQMYSYIADRSLNSVYKFFFRLAQPSFVISRYPILWQRFFKSGSVEVSGAGPGGARLDFTLQEIFLDWIRPACLGYSTRAVSLSGGSELELEEVERSQLPDGDWRISYELTWKE